MEECFFFLLCTSQRTHAEIAVLECEVNCDGIAGTLARRKQPSIAQLTHKQKSISYNGLKLVHSFLVQMGVSSGMSFALMWRTRWTIALHGQSDVAHKHFPWTKQQAQWPVFSVNSILLVIEGESCKSDCFWLQIIQRGFDCKNVLSIDLERDATESKRERSDSGHHLGWSSRGILLVA